MTDAPPSVASPADRARIVSLAPTQPVRARWIATTLAFFVVLALTYRPDAAVLKRLVLPDSLEYASAAQRLATRGEFAIPIDNRPEPSRYPPSFSLLLSPAYFIAPDNFVAGVWVCRALWAAGCGAFAFSLAGRFGIARAVFVIALLHVHPLVLATASTILSDMPSLAALLAMFAMGQRVTAPRARSLFPIGVALGGAVACRSLALAFALPFLLDLRRQPRPPRAAIALLAPAALVMAGNAFYNRVRFGSFAMNGYVYWCPMPYARLDYVFHLSYVAWQWKLIHDDPWLWVTAVLGLLAAGALFVWNRPAWRAYAAPLLLAVVPIALLHLFYFSTLPRFFLPAIVASSACVGIATVALLPRFAFDSLVLSIVTFALAAGTLATVADDLRTTRLIYEDMFDQMRASLPDRCRIITRFDPVIVDAFALRGTHREWVAARRSQEYADKTIADRAIDLSGVPRPPPLDHLAPILLARGARLAVPLTADDDALLDELADRSSPPTFIDQPTMQAIPTLVRRLGDRFTLRPVPGAPLLFECLRRDAAAR